MSKFLEEAKELEKRWGQSKLMSGIEESCRRQMIKQLLENQAAMNAATSAPDASELKRIKIPLIRRLQGPQMSPSDPILSGQGTTKPKRRRPVIRDLDDEWES
jgi:hypothetical protein